jgi:hypothetical protein
MAWNGKHVSRISMFSLPAISSAKGKVTHTTKKNQN